MIEVVINIKILEDYGSGERSRHQQYLDMKAVELLSCQEGCDNHDHDHDLGVTIMFMMT